MSGVVTSITSVFTALGGWLTTTIGSMQAVFWDSTASSLTFVGTLAVCSLGIAVTLMVINLVKRFIRFR